MQHHRGELADGTTPALRRSGITRLTATLLLMIVTMVACGTGEQPPHGHAPPPPPPADRTPSPPPPTPTRAWSDAAGWSAGVLPAEGDSVVIGHGDVVLLDVSPPPLAGLMIDGALVFDDRDLELTADWIMVHGGFYIGSSQRPFEHRAVITLTGPWSSDDPSGMFMGTKLLGAMHHGIIEFYGIAAGPSWTRLLEHTQPGDTTIRVEDASGWLPGDRIVLASTDYEMWEGQQGSQESRDIQVEEHTIESVNGNVITLADPIEYFRVGRNETVGGIFVDQRAEVARLTRNIVVQGDQASLDPASASFRFGGQMMVMDQARLRLEGVELRRMGQLGQLARYPIHFHVQRDAGYGSYVAHTSIHTSFHRCLTIHGTNGVLVHDVVAYNSYGHCFFFEDAAETGNELYHNLALMIRRPPDDNRVLMSDVHHLGPAGFWVTNPDNDLVGNVAASSQGTGFWYALPERPTGLFHDLHGDAGIRPQHTPLGLFQGNVAHSNGSIGLHVDNGPTLDLLGVPPTWYEPRANPLDPGSAPVLAVFEDFSAYRHRRAGVWFRGDHTLLRGGVLSDNAVGATFASHETWAENVAFVGETNNLGTPRHWEITGPDGRSLPRSWSPEAAAFAIRGFEFYDGAIGIRDSRFAGFASNSLREAGALSYLDFTSFSVSPLNAASGLTFAPGTRRVHLVQRDPGPAGDGEDGYRSALFIDLDGSVTGTARAVVTVANEFLTDASCAFRSEWTAYVCSGPYASLTLDDVRWPAAGLGPVTIARSDGSSHVMLGSPSSGPASYFRTLLRLDHDHHYSFTGTSEHVRLNLQDIPQGTSMTVSLPWPGAAPYIYRDWWIDERSLLPSFPSVAALQTASGPGYHHDGSTLHVKLVQREDDASRDWAQVEICRQAYCN